MLIDWMGRVEYVGLGVVLCGLVVGVEVDDSINVSLAVERDEL
jgi:hypothetical protein